MQEDAPEAIVAAMGGIAEAFLGPENAHGPSTILLQGQSYKTSSLRGTFRTKRFDDDLGSTSANANGSYCIITP
jgi:hypothetical protein